MKFCKLLFVILVTHTADGIRRAKDPLDVLRDQLTGVADKTDGVLPGTGSSLTRVPFDPEARRTGTSWCDKCYTMVGTLRLDNERQLLEAAFTNNVEGDFLEAGAWRGGASIFARAVQKRNGKGPSTRTYVCDSFSGLPRASTPMNSSHWSRMDFLSVSQKEVRGNFEKFGMLDSNVHFVPGFFKDSLPDLRASFKKEGRKLAVLRGDGDMFESFYDILFNMYEFIPVGGYFICDDCPKIAAAQKAIDAFRAHHGIHGNILDVEHGQPGTYWRKLADVHVDYAFYENWCKTRQN